VRSAPRPLSTAIQSLTAALAPATTLARVQEIWEGTTGRAIAAAAKPTAERNGVLTVTCEAAVWAQELDLMASELIPTLNAALASLDPKLGEETIRELRCRTG
jgi:predicted nucleic acid-binding Zn ribbon protein